MLILLMPYVHTCMTVLDLPSNLDFAAYFQTASFTNSRFQNR